MGESFLALSQDRACDKHSRVQITAGICLPKKKQVFWWWNLFEI